MLDFLKSAFIKKKEVNPEPDNEDEQQVFDTIRTESKPGWYMINHYDEDGDYEGATFEPMNKE